MAEARKNDWREKYLSVVEHQERQEKKLNDQLEQMRRALVRVSLAADGVDLELDKVLEALREHLKSSQFQNLSNRLNVVEEAVLAFDDRKQQRQVQLQWALESLCSQLQRLHLSRELTNQLKRYGSDLKQRLQNLQEIPKLVKDLAEIQAQVLNGLALKKPGLFEKISDIATKFTSPSDETQPTGGQVIDGHYEPLDDAEDDELRRGAVQSEPHQFVQPATPDLELIAERVAAVLRQLLDNIEPVDCVEAKIDNARARIKRGLTWTDLVPTLEDVRDLVVQSTITAHDEFERYLSRINQELLGICQHITVTAGEAHVEQQQQRQLQSAVDHQIQAIELSVQRATELETLKAEVATHIQQIRTALTQPQARKKSLTDQIKILLDQVENLEQEARQISKNLNEQKVKAQHDSLTGLPNRDAYMERGHLEFTRWKRYHDPLVLAVVDIDHFKKVNDTFGHQAGDKVLKLVGLGLKKRLREVDFIARYGGEEFVILLPKTAPEAAFATLNKVREAIATTPFHFKRQPVTITVSIGISAFMDDDTLDVVFARADKALYKAKADGRNRCEIA